MHLRTRAVTTSWVALPSLNAEKVDMLNLTGADLQVRYADETGVDELVTIPDKAPLSLIVSANSNEVQIRAAAGASGVQLFIK